MATVEWSDLLDYFERMTTLTLLTVGDATAIAVNAFFAALVIAKYDPEFADDMRHALEVRAAEEQGVAAEQMEVLIRASVESVRRG